jgi:phytoene dehydrogenase-like protein
MLDAGVMREQAAQEALGNKGAGAEHEVRLARGSKTARPSSGAGEVNAPNGGKKLLTDHRPDEKGFVATPSDPTAYRPAKEIVANFPRYAPNQKALIRILREHPEIRRWSPKPHRLSVHMGDWQKHIERQEGINRQAAIEAARRSVWICSACHKFYADMIDTSCCPGCKQAGTLKPIIGRPGK